MEQKQEPIQEEEISKVDQNLPQIKDPRIVNQEKQRKPQKIRSVTSFNPKSTLVRPSMRIIIGPNIPVFGK